MTPCTIKDYLMDIKKTDENGVYESHEVAFRIFDLGVDHDGPATLLSTSLKSHPNGRSHSYGNLNIKIQKYHMLQILIGKKVSSSHTILASIKTALMALSITM